MRQRRRRTHLAGAQTDTVRLSVPSQRQRYLCALTNYRLKQRSLAPLILRGKFIFRMLIGPTTRT